MIPEAEPSAYGQRQHDRPRADEVVCHSGGVVIRDCRRRKEPLFCYHAAWMSQLRKSSQTPCQANEAIERRFTSRRDDVYLDRRSDAGREGYERNRIALDGGGVLVLGKFASDGRLISSTIGWGAPPGGS